MHERLELRRVLRERHLADVVVHRRRVRERRGELKNEERHDADNPHDDNRAEQPGDDESDHNLFP
jgi:hypothetical protein